MATGDTQKIPRNDTQELGKTKVARRTRRVLVSIVGVALILLGLFLIPLPGPLTLPLVFAGLTVLSWEYAWAKRALLKVRKKWREFRPKVGR
ncbi:MAG TPA: PGPGW domain-containing protein [Actinomycetota bacterium]|nr:PGPGW domain-containing protein [Actinomycetota bacterium]